MNISVDEHVNSDVVILGGGVSALWVANLLHQRGYRVVLIESAELGCGQTGFSQGIIHGGMKYALTGKVTDASRAVSNMTTLWNEALSGDGEIDLSSVNILSKTHNLCFMGGVTRGLKSLIGSQLLASESRVLNKDLYHAFLQKPSFNGRICEINEMVLDVPDLVSALAKPLNLNLYRSVEKATVHCLSQDKYGISIIDENKKNIMINPKKILFMAGAGNQDYTSLFNKKNIPCMQTRPLHMAVVLLKEPLDLYMHIVEKGHTPKLTITTHHTQNGQAFWYLGGELSEMGVSLSSEALIETAKKRLHHYFPWYCFDSCRWKTHRIDRAEGATVDGSRPQSTVLLTSRNAMMAWPTKLTLAPMLAMQICEKVEAAGLSPSGVLRARIIDLPIPPLSAGIRGVFNVDA